MQSRKNQRGRNDATRMAEVVHWSDLRLKRLVELVQDFQRSGLDRQAAALAAYRQLIGQRRAS